LILIHALGRGGADAALERGGSGVMMIPIPRAGILNGVAGEERARATPGIEELRVTVPRGDRLVPLPEGSRYLGFLFARAAGPAEVERSLRAAHRELSFEITETVD